MPTIEFTKKGILNEILQIKDKDESLPLSSGKNLGLQDIEGHEKIKAAKNSLV